MPLPWKKSRVGRISRLVADLQQSPKRGGSLVVETGFPTSLIDLFVKNRDRLKKSSKRRHVEPSPSSAPPPPLSSSPSPPPYQPPSLGSPCRPEEREAAGNENALVKDVVAVKAGDGDAGGDADRRRVGGPKVFMAVLKVFVVVVLALSTKKLALGITLSAFALLFLEFAAARPLHGRIFLDSLINMIFRERKAKIIQTLNAKSCEITECFEDSKNRTERIRIRDVLSRPEPELVVVQDKKWDRLDTESKPRVTEGEESGCKNERSKSSKLKSKIVKKIVPKKFRKKKSKKNKERKDREESASEASSIISDDKSEKIEDESPEKDEDWQSLRDEICIEEEDSHVGVDESEKNYEIESKGNKGFMILVLIVLCGLLGGRVLAIGLTLLWCSVLRICRKF